MSIGLAMLLLMALVPPAGCVRNENVAAIAIAKKAKTHMDRAEGKLLREQTRIMERSNREHDRRPPSKWGPDLDEKRTWYDKQLIKIRTARALEAERAEVLYGKALAAGGSAEFNKYLTLMRNAAWTLKRSLRFEARADAIQIRIEAMNRQQLAAADALDFDASPEDIDKSMKQFDKEGGKESSAIDERLLDQWHTVTNKAQALDGKYMKLRENALTYAGEHGISWALE